MHIHCYSQPAKLAVHRNFCTSKAIRSQALPDNAHKLSQRYSKSMGLTSIEHLQRNSDYTLLSIIIVFKEINYKLCRKMCAIKCARRQNTNYFGNFRVLRTWKKIMPVPISIRNRRGREVETNRRPEAGLPTVATERDAPATFARHVAGSGRIGARESRAPA